MRRRLSITLLIISGCALASFFPDDAAKLSLNSTKALLPDYGKAMLVIQQFESQMAPDVTQNGGHLHIVVEPQNMKINAEARRHEREWTIAIFGGLLGHPEMGEAELTMILCHELGHHLGGTPTAARGGWSACEGQADYWSTLECFEKVRPHSDARSVALKLTEFYARMTGSRIPSLECRDETRQTRTFFGYPTPQCRLDTLLAGLEQRPRPECWFTN